MKSLNKIMLITALGTMPFTANAELKVLADAAMSELTGQAGLTIELDATVSIGEINYKDEGNVFINNLKFGGAGMVEALRGETVVHGDRFDNVKYVIDVAGGAADSAALTANWGLQRVDLSTGNIVEVANLGTHGEIATVIDDGDLVISPDEVVQGEGVDYGLVIDRVSLGKSTLGAGDGATNSGTTLVSNFRSSGTFGPTDIVIDASSNNINLNTYIDQETDLTFDFIATSMTVKFHNSRGRDQLVYHSNVTGRDASFAHVQADIGANADPAKGLYINITDLSGDVDMTNITFGSAPSIGDVYLTDMSIAANLNVYGH